MVQILNNANLKNILQLFFSFSCPAHSLCRQPNVFFLSSISAKHSLLFYLLKRCKEKRKQAGDKKGEAPLKRHSPFLIPHKDFSFFPSFSPNQQAQQAENKCFACRHSKRRKQMHRLLILLFFHHQRRLLAIRLNQPLEIRRNIFCILEDIYTPFAFDPIIICRTTILEHATTIFILV